MKNPALLLLEKFRVDRTIDRQITAIYIIKTSNS